MATPTLTIVILSYNVSTLLQNCLKSVMSAKKPSDHWQVVVVDNASSDDSLAKVKAHFPQTKIIANKSNLGFSAGNNVALRRVKTKYALLLNPDTIVYPDTIQTVMAYMDSHPDVGAATCRVELPDGQLDYSCHRRFPDPWNSFIYFFTAFGRRSSYANSDVPDRIHQIDALTGAFALIRTSAGKDLDWLDQDYWWNGEDLDFCYRLKSAGWKIVYIPQVKIKHFKGSSSGIWSTGKFHVSVTKKIYSMNAGISAMRIFYDKHYASRYPAPFNWFIYLGMFTLRLWRTARVYLVGSK